MNKERKRIKSILKRLKDRSMTTIKVGRLTYLIKKVSENRYVVSSSNTLFFDDLLIEDTFTKHTLIEVMVHEIEIK